MKQLILIAALLGGSFLLPAQIEQYSGNFAQERLSIAKELAYKNGNPIPIYIEFKEGDEPTIEELTSILKDELGMNEALHFQLRNTSNDALGFEHSRYYQFFHGHAIEMAWLNVHSFQGKIKSINGNIEIQPQVTGSQLLDEVRSLERALDFLGATSYKWEIPSEERHLQLELDDQNATYYPKGELVWMNTELDIHQPLKLCYKFNIYAQEPLGRYHYYVNTANGSIEYIESLLHTGDKPGIAYTGYSGVLPIIADSVSNYYRLRESGRGNGIETYDLNTGTNYANAVDFIDSNNVWNAFTVALDRYATDAHIGTEMTYDYFSLIHNRNSIDGNGFALRSYVHYSRNYVNAFWDGQRMTYGDGDATTTPLTTLDICGHEVTHGLTNFTSNLIYANESGALNESFSDIFGVCIENFARPSNWNWLMGEDIGSAFRSMSSPNRYGDPDTYGGVNWINQNCIPTAGNDRCGVHTNSGVQNHWFYLLTDGGTGINDIGDAYTVNGLGIIKSAKIAFRNNTVYLGRSSNYQEARFYSIKSAVDLFGACSPEVQEVANAWHAVGVGSRYKPGVSADFVAIKDTSFCYSPISVEFKAEGNNVLNFRWNFGDGTSSLLPNPVHFYANYGVYDVQLIADGGACGQDTVLKTSYIYVDSTIRCSYYMGSDRSTSACTGNLYDNGGLNGNYAVNSQDTFTIAPGSADQIVLYFDYFDLQNGDKSFCNKDFLEIYDGDTGSPIIGKYCGNNPPPDSIVSSGNRLTLVFSSDLSKVAQGFRSFWKCGRASAPPQADFYTPIDTLCSPEVSFADNSNGAVTSWLWNFGDGTTSTLQNPTHIYNQDGSYTVSLRASNSVGSDVVTKSNVVHIQRLPMPMVSSDTACLGGRIKLGASGNGTLQWFDQSAGGTLMFQGDTVRINNLTKDTAFYVQYFQRPNSISGPFSIPGSGYYSDSSEAIYFDVFEPMILESVILNSNRLGPRRIDLRNSAGKIIQSKTMPVSGVPQQIQIGFVIYPGNGYSLSIGSSNPSLYINSTGATYPYSFGNYMNLTGSSLGPNAYPFFYYWTIRPLSCYSSRALAEGKVDTTCVITDLPESANSKGSFEIYPNPSRNGFYLSTTSSQRSELSIYSIEGRLIRRETLNAGIDLQSKSFGDDLPAAMYLVNVQDGSEIKQFKWVKTQ